MKEKDIKISTNLGFRWSCHLARKAQPGGPTQKRTLKLASGSRQIKLYKQQLALLVNADLTSGGAQQTHQYLSRSREEWTHHN